MNALDEAGSVLTGAWEVYIGNEAGSAVWQLRQFDSMADWEIHQDRIRADNQLSEARKQNLYLHLDEVNTSILRLADISPALPAEWPGFDDVRGTERGGNEQRILRFQISAAPDHHTLYRDKYAGASARRSGTHRPF